MLQQGGEVGGVSVLVDLTTSGQRGEVRPLRVECTCRTSSHRNDLAARVQVLLAELISS